MESNLAGKSSSWHLYVLDAATGDVLWTTKTGGQGKTWRMWSSIAKSLLPDVQMRLKYCAVHGTT
jgi:outer membrane protein assembly factor BamB